MKDNIINSMQPFDSEVKKGEPEGKVEQKVENNNNAVTPQKTADLIP